MTDNLKIRKADLTHPSEWDDYVLRHPHGTLFHLTRWQQAIEQSFGHPQYDIVAVQRTGPNTPETIVGILPLTQIKSPLFGHYLVSAAFAEVGGVLADNPQVETALVDYAVNLAQELACDYLELKNQHPVAGLLTKDLYYNFSKELLPELEENLLAIPRKSRAAVRKGIKSGLVAEFDKGQLDTFYEMMARSYHQLGTPIFARGFFESFLHQFGDDAEILIIRTSQGVPIAGVLGFYFKDRIMPYYGGSLAAYRQLCPNDFMYWELLKRGWEKGYRIFDYGRSKIGTGSYSFKKHWGFEPTLLAYQYQLVKLDELPNLSPANPKYARKIEMWRRMPFFMSKILGPPLAKYLG